MKFPPQYFLPHHASPFGPVAPAADVSKRYVIPAIAEHTTGNCSERVGECEQRMSGPYKALGRRCVREGHKCSGTRDDVLMRQRCACAWQRKGGPFAAGRMYVEVSGRVRAQQMTGEQWQGYVSSRVGQRALMTDSENWAEAAGCRSGKHTIPCRGWPFMLKGREAIANER